MINITYADSIVKLKELREQKAALAKEHLGNASKALFEEHPKLQAYKWRQYTPYFNDEDECVFSVYSDPSLKYEGAEDGEFFEDYDVEEGHEAKSLFKLVRTMLSTLEDEDMKSVFGDHIE